MKIENNKFKVFYKSTLYCGFTIVELIVVISVIAILTAIAVVSYGGMVRKASTVSIQSDLDSAISQLAIDKYKNGTYPLTANDVDNNNGFKLSPNTIIDYKYKASNNSYCVMTQNSYGDSYYSTSNVNKISQGYCPVSFVIASGGPLQDNAVAIAQSNDSTYVIAGETYNNTAGADDAYIAKFKNDGTPIWAKTLGTTGNELAEDVIKTNDGGYVMIGQYASPYFIAKYTVDGVLLWTKTLLITLKSIKQTSDNGYLIAGSTYSYGAGNGDAILIKLGANGAFSWSKTWGGATGAETGLDAIQSSDGGYVMTGQTASFGSGSYDIFVVKYTSNGTLVWDKVWGGSGDDQVWQIIQTSDSNYVIVGNTPILKDGWNFADILVIKFSQSDGSIIWQSVNGANRYDYGKGIVETSDGFFVAGTSNYMIHDYDISLSKYTKDGSLSWIKAVSNTSTDQARSIALANDGGVLITGFTMMGTNSEAIVVKYNSDGTIDNCDISLCITPVVTPGTPTISLSDPNAVESSPTLVVSSVSPTVLTPAFAQTMLAAP